MQSVTPNAERENLNNVRIELLEPKKDESLLKEAWSWAESAPAWFKEASDSWKETFTDFLKSSEDELLFGVFIDDLISAVIRLIPAGNQVFVIHLYAKRKTPFDVLVQAGNSLKEYLFDKGVYGFYGWIPKQNRSIIKLYELLGFSFSGYRQYKASDSGRVFEWRQMINSQVNAG